MHRLALFGMNIGGDFGVQATGELAVLHFVKAHARGRVTIFDVGANTGSYAAAVLDVFGDAVDLHCFEPSTEAFARLTTSIGHRWNVVFHRFGLGRRSETARLFSDTPGSPLASVYQRVLGADRPGLSQSETVSLQPLDDVCDRQNISHIDLLKLDIEGHELSALIGAERMLRRGAIQAIQFEFGGCNVDSRTYLRDFFELLGPSYRVHRIVTDGFVPLSTYTELAEIFVTTNFLALRRLSPPH